MPPRPGASSGSASSFTYLSCSVAAPPGYLTNVSSGAAAIATILGGGVSACTAAAGSACFTVGYQCYTNPSYGTVIIYRCQ